VDDLGDLPAEPYVEPGGERIDERAIASVE